jgi:hypothetical protein
MLKYVTTAGHSVCILKKDLYGLKQAPKHYFLGLEVWKRHDEIFLNQGKYTIEILKRFRDVVLQGNGYTYGIKYEVVVGYKFRDSRCYFIQVDGGFIDELEEHKTRYIF